MKLDDYGTMLVIVDGQVERRAIDYVHRSPMGHGMVQYEPVLKENEIVMHTITGEVHIVKTGL